MAGAAGRNIYAKRICWTRLCDAGTFKVWLHFRCIDHSGKSRQARASNRPRWKASNRIGRAVDLFTRYQTMTEGTVLPAQHRSGAPPPCITGDGDSVHRLADDATARSSVRVRHTRRAAALWMARNVRPGPIRVARLCARTVISEIAGNVDAAVYDGTHTAFGFVIRIWH